MPPPPPKPPPPAPPSATSQPNETTNAAADSRALLATLEKLRALEGRREAPQAHPNPPRGGAPGGGTPSGVDNARLSASDRQRIGDKLRECWALEPGDRSDLQEARRAGWAVSRGEVIPGLRSVAAPVLGPDGGARAALALVFVDDDADIAALGEAVATAATRVSTQLH